MKKYIFIIISAIVMVGCKKNFENSTSYMIKGKTFAADMNAGIMEIHFNSDLSTIYTWKNTWEKEAHKRADLHSVINDNTSFTIYTNEDNGVWGNGTYHAEKIPYILLDNLSGDTLYIK